MRERYAAPIPLDTIRFMYAGASDAAVQLEDVVGQDSVYAELASVHADIAAFGKNHYDIENAEVAFNDALVLPPANLRTGRSYIRGVIESKIRLANDLGGAYIGLVLADINGYFPEPLSDDRIDLLVELAGSGDQGIINEAMSEVTTDDKNQTLQFSSLAYLGSLSPEMILPYTLSVAKDIEDVEVLRTLLESGHELTPELVLLAEDRFKKINPDTMVTQSPLAGGYTSDAFVKHLVTLHALTGNTVYQEAYNYFMSGMPTSAYKVTLATIGAELDYDSVRHIETMQATLKPGSERSDMDYLAIVKAASKHHDFDYARQVMAAISKDSVRASALQEIACHGGRKPDEPIVAGIHQLIGDDTPFVSDIAHSFVATEAVKNHDYDLAASTVDYMKATYLESSNRTQYSPCAREALYCNA